MKLVAKCSLLREIGQLVTTPAQKLVETKSAKANSHQ